MLRSLIETASNIEKLGILFSSGISSGGSTILSDFLATNPRLTVLNLEGNELDNSDAALIANALRTNSTLRKLDLRCNDITSIGIEALQTVLDDGSSLNTAAGSNHSCEVILFHIPPINVFEEIPTNRGWKIYRLLSSRNQAMSNVKHFDDIDVKILPNMLEHMRK